MFTKPTRKISVHKDGATALEYALLLPVLVWMIMGIIEYNLVMYSSAIVDGAITAGARMGKTGYNNTTSTGTCPSPMVNGVVTPQAQITFITCYINSRTFGLLDTTQLLVYAKDYGSTFSASDAPVACTNAVTTPQTIPLCNTINLGTAGDVVVYTATYPWKITTPFLQNVLGSNGTFKIQASSVVKNEPYSTTSVR